MVNRKQQYASNTNVNVPLQRPSLDFSKIRIGLKSLEDAIYELGDLKKAGSLSYTKEDVFNALVNKDYSRMREISDYFFRVSGIYSRLCRYLAYLYRFDWFVTPYINAENLKEEKILDGFYKVLNFLDNFEIKKYFGEVALKVIRYGCYYGYCIPDNTNNKCIIQELPANYCRTRFSVGGRPAIEFNMKFFDDSFKDVSQRDRILNLFPKEFKKGYMLYKQGKLTGDFVGDQRGWYLLDPEYSIKFNINGEDFPMLFSVIPSIIDLNEAQDLDRKKMQQELLKIIIQKMPLDKNGDLVFDVDEAKELHKNALGMLQKAIGVDVLTTFADVDVADMSDNTVSSAKDELERVERAVYNEAGVSQMQFNTDGNIALEKSILNDEASLYNLITQFEGFLNDLIKPFNKSPKKLYYKVQILTTTIYNYKEMAKLYKEQTQLGYSKMLPQIALGQSQSSILANAHFENDILDLIHVFIPPLMSSTMNAEVLSGHKEAAEHGQAGRKEKEDDQKSEKTIANREAMN